MTITSGGMFSNACLNVNGSGLTLDVTEDIFYRTDANIPEVVTSPPLHNSPERCSKRRRSMRPAITTRMPRISKTLPTLGASTELSPGKYRSISVHGSHDQLTLKPGLYCLYGDFTASSGTVIGEGVTIYLMPDSHGNATNFRVNAGTKTEEPVIRLSAPVDPDHPGTESPECFHANYEGGATTNYCPPAIKGVLIYLAVGNAGGVSLEGNSTSQFTGMVFAPSGTVDIGGNNNSTTTDLASR